MGYSEIEYTFALMSNIHLPEYKEIIDRFIAARLKAGLTQQQVAKALKKPQSYISKIENCERRLDVLEAKWLEKLYKILND